MHGGWGTWVASWGWSALLIGVTVAIHATGVVLLAKWVGAIGRDVRKIAFLRTPPGTVALIVGVALCLAFLFAVESAVWAVAYVQLGALPDPAASLLYSVGSMTTRGSPDVRVEEQWRMMGAVEAANGVLLFGISTAFLFSVMHWLWAHTIWESRR